MATQIVETILTPTRGDCRISRNVDKCVQRAAEVLEALPDGPIEYADLNAIRVDGATLEGSGNGSHHGEPKFGCAPVCAFP